jgi:hypothetical protein
MGSINCGGFRGTLGEDLELMLGGVVNPPQRLYKYEANLGATRKCIRILPQLTSYPPFPCVVTERILLFQPPFRAPKD